MKKEEKVLAILGLVFLVGLKLTTKLELGDGLPYHIATTLKMYANTTYAIWQPQPPLYYYFLALIYGLTKSVLTIQLISPLFATALLIITYRFIKEGFGRKIAFTTAIILLFIPDFVGMSVSSHLEAFTTITILLTFDNYMKNKKIKAGILLGIALLSKYTSIMMIPLLATHEIIQFLTKRKIDIKKLAVVTIIGCALFSPVLLKNYILYKNPFYPRFVEESSIPDLKLIQERYGGIIKYLAMTLSSYYFSNSNVGNFFPEEGRFAEGSLIFGSWGNAISIQTPSEEVTFKRYNNIHILDIISITTLSILTLYGVRVIIKNGKWKYYLNYMLWFIIVYILYSSTLLAATSTRFMYPAFPIFALLPALAINNIKDKKIKNAVLIITLLCFSYLYILQVARAVIFAQNIEYVLNHEYIKKSFEYAYPLLIK